MLDGLAATGMQEGGLKYAEAKRERSESMKTSKDKRAHSRLH